MLNTRLPQSGHFLQVKHVSTFQESAVTRSQLVTRAMRKVATFCPYKIPQQRYDFPSTENKKPER